MTERKSWKVGESTAYKGRFDREVLEEYRQAGITCMELSCSSETLFEKIDFLHNPCSVFSLALEYGVTITSLHLPFNGLDLASLEEEQRQATVALLSRYLLAAGKAGIGIAVVHPSGEPYPENEREDRMKACVASLKSLQATATAAGVVLAAENLPRTCLGRNTQEMLQLLESVPGLKICFDTNHSLIDANPNFIRTLGGNIVTLHISDYDFVDERHVLPGVGCNDWPGILSALEETDYSGPFMYEVPRVSHFMPLEPITLLDVTKTYRELMR